MRMVPVMLGNILLPFDKQKFQNFTQHWSLRLIDACQCAISARSEGDGSVLTFPKLTFGIFIDVWNRLSDFIGDERSLLWSLLCKAS